MLKKLFPDKTCSELQLNNIKAVFFDLDGTLIDVDMTRFVHGYLHRLGEEMSGLDKPERVIQAIHKAVAAMFTNENAEQTLEVVLHKTLLSELSIQPEDYNASLERFCQRRLSELQPLVTGHGVSADLVEQTLTRGWQPVLATNPIFPRDVVEARIRWGGAEQREVYPYCCIRDSSLLQAQPGFLC